MSFNLLDSIKALFNNDIVSKAASLFGESQGGIQKAIAAIVPSVLGGALFKTNSGDAAGVLSLAKNAAHKDGVLGSLQNLLQGNTGALLSKGTELVKGLFGDKTGAIASSVSNYAGISQSSANSLLAVAAPVTLGKLGEYAEEKNLDASGLSRFLGSQKDLILGALPSGFSLGSLGLGNLASATDDVRRTAASTVNYTKETYEKKRGSIFPWVLLLAALALAAWYFLFRNKGDENKVTVTDTTNTVTQQTVPEPTPVTVPITRESMKVILPNGTELDAYKGGIEDQLVAFLKSDWKTLGTDSLKSRWFDFDDLNFKTGSAEITPESQRQVDNITAILKAFPGARLKIGGYTDKTGDEPGNKKLSNERAQAVKAALEKAGVGGQITGAEGYGSEFAKYPADAPESDRKTDRRVSVSVRDK